jgi:hypothetical protein
MTSLHYRNNIVLALSIGWLASIDVIAYLKCFVMIYFQLLLGKPFAGERGIIGTRFRGCQ